MAADINGIPAIGLGTFGLTGADGLAAMTSALKIGYRHLDTAQSYGTEANVGQAIARSGLDRRDVFITTKVATTALHRIGASIDDSLRTMGLDHADLVLIHWPAADDIPSVRACIADLARAQDAGKTRLIGVSNFTRRHVDEAIAEVGAGRLATNQVERHVFLQNHVLADHCRAHGIALTAYLPIARGQLQDAPELARVAARHDAAPTQIALAYLLALDTVVIPKSASPERQESNLHAGDIVLDDEDIAALRGLDRGTRFIDPATAPNWD